MFWFVCFLEMVFCLGFVLGGRLHACYMFVYITMRVSVSGVCVRGGLRGSVCVCFWGIPCVCIYV